MNTACLSSIQPAHYRLRIEGHLTADWESWLSESSFHFEENQTVLTGVVCDQAALFGLLALIRDLGAPLLLVEYIPNPQIFKENTMKNTLFKSICNGIAVAMGIAVIVTNLVNPLSPANLGSLLGIGVAVLGIAALQK